ncbi:MAG: SGNH/GDSL hydrolase family protein, partial [Clostridia bacterium]|nr:SGNH/GDSL hydrolase family protein [Clostridia bacterium]
MKRILAVVLVLVLVISFTACGNNNNAGETGGTSAEPGATSTETPLSNSVKLLNTEKKLTIGYIGGSITLGSSAAQYLSGSDLNKEANLMNSWVNRMSTYFATNYPNATIETVNAGISNTQTNFGIYRLTKHLMNTDGHDMPDLVFIEFTSNDWNDGDDLKVEIESLFRNIYAANPYAEIVVLSTNVNSANASRKLYRELCEEYNIPFVDVGSKL